MRFRFQPWQMAVALVVLCAGGIALLQWRRSSRNFDAGQLIACLPQEHAVKVYLDVEDLRASGLLDILAGSRAAEEPDYRNFVEETGFDYRTDLDAVAATFVNGNVYMAIRGHFDWTRLSQYAKAQQGHCLNTICSMPASQPNRSISFYPMSSRVLALAISKEERGVTAIVSPSGKLAVTPSVPLWVSAPGAVFKDIRDAPAGSQSFLSPLGQVQEAAFSVGPASAAKGSGSPGDSFEVRMDATCASPDSAANLVVQYTSTTNLLRSMLDRDHMTPNPADLSGVLAGGRFESEGSHAIGTWPLDRRFFQSLLSGQVR